MSRSHFAAATAFTGLACLVVGIYLEFGTSAALGMGGLILGFVGLAVWLSSPSA